VDQLRAIYRAPDPGEAAALLEEWCQAAFCSDLEPFPKAALTLTDHALRSSTRYAWASTSPASRP